MSNQHWPKALSQFSQLKYTFANRNKYWVEFWLLAQDKIFAHFGQNYIKMILGTYNFQDLFLPQLLQIFENFIVGFL